MKSARTLDRGTGLLIRGEVKSSFLVFNIVGADTRLENNLFNRMEKAKRPYCKLAELIYDDVKACRETYTEILNYM